MKEKIVWSLLSFVLFISAYYNYTWVEMPMINFWSVICGVIYAITTLYVFFWDED